jgi:hypothetical protein
MPPATKTDKGTLIVVEDPEINLTIDKPLPSETAYDDVEVLSETAHERDEFDVMEEESAEDKG